MAEQLRIEYMPISSLRRASRNPKDHDIGALDSSMNRFGFTSPMAINESTGKLVAGHGRLDTLQQRKAAGLPAPSRVSEQNGEWLAPVIRGLSFDTDEEAEAYLLADNRMPELGGWDDVELADMLSELAAADSLDGVGWDGDDVDRLLRDLEPERIDHITVTAEAQMDPKTRMAEQYETTSIRVIQLVMDVSEYEEALDILGEMPFDTNTDAVMHLLREWKNG